VIEGSFEQKRGWWKSPHPPIAGVLEFIRLDEMLVGLGRQTRALHQLN
jgi:hypothetical protein